MRQYGITAPAVVAAAYLHDAVEDKNATDELRLEFAI
jgi:hypothetical protein